MKILSTEDINIIIIITDQRYYPCTIATLKSISRNRANLIAPPSCMANVRFNIGRYPAENKSAGNSIRYLGTTIHRKRLIFALVIHQRNIADHASRPSTFSSPVRNGINFARDLQRTCIAIDSPNLRYTLRHIHSSKYIYIHINRKSPMRVRANWVSFFLTRERSLGRFRLGGKRGKYECWQIVESKGNKLFNNVSFSSELSSYACYFRLWKHECSTWPANKTLIYFCLNTNRLNRITVAM